MVNYKKYANQSYSELKENAKKSGQLFTDNIFIAETSSLFYSRSSPPFPVEWKRPKVNCCFQFLYVTCIQLRMKHSEGFIYQTM